jgi:hypothetical protein
MRLPSWTWPVLRLLRSWVARLQRWPIPPAVSGPARPIPPVPDGWQQPTNTTCGSSVVVALGYLASGVEPLDFAAAARAVMARTNSPVDRAGRLQLPWPPALGTRPAALVRELGGTWTSRVVDPRRPGRAYDVLVGFVTSGQAIPLYIGEGSWMQHIVLVVGATDHDFSVYDPAVGRTVRRTREQFERGALDLVGWDQPWLVIVPKSS